MPMTKVVNGKRVNMTPEEEAAHITSHPPQTPTRSDPSDADVIAEALKAKSVLTQADLAAARRRLKS